MGIDAAYNKTNISPYTYETKAKNEWKLCNKSHKKLIEPQLKEKIDTKQNKSYALKAE